MLVYDLLKIVMHGANMKIAAPFFRQKTIKWVIWLILGLYMAVVLFPSHLNHDVAWILYSSGQMLNGAEFGKDILDITPPLIWWLNWPPAFLAQMFDLSPALMFRVYVVLLIATSIALVKISLPKIAHWKLAAAAAILVFLPGYDFGQREHFMVILALAYLVGSMQPATHSCGPARIASGVLAGIGFCIKPHFLLIPICVELLTMVRSRKILAVFRCETIIMGFIGVLYIAATFIFAPEYLSTVVPEAMVNYSAYNNPVLPVLKSLINKTVLPLLALGALIYAQVRWGFALAFLYAAIGAVLSALIQSKGWNYHALPISMLLAMAAVFAVPSRKYHPGYFLGLALVFLTLALPTMKFTKDFISPDGRHALVSALAKRIEVLPGNRKIFAFITSPRDIWPAIISANGHWTGSAASLYLLPAAVNHPQDAKAVLNADRQLARIAARLVREKPSMIIVNASKYHLAISQTGFNYINYLKRYKTYGEIFSHYKQTDMVGHYQIFTKIP